MSKGDLPGAIARWKELTAKEPSADNWNDLSYAQLLAGQYTDAAASAYTALKLNPNHAGAQYNVGMALLERPDLTTAAVWLDRSARAQPDRFEPLIGLARAALAEGEAGLAGHYLSKARQIAGGEAEAAKWQPALDKLTAPGPAPASCAAQLTDGPVSLCVTDSAQRRELYLLAGQGPAQRTTLGHAWQLIALEKGSLPDGRVAYWVKSQSAVVDVYVWQAFVVSDGKLRQLLFQGGSDIQMLGTDEFVKSYAMPRVKGNELEASHRHEADPSKGVTMRFRLAPKGFVAEQSFYQEGPLGK